MELAKTKDRFEKLKRILLSRKTKTRIFVILMLAYPVLHFLFFWVFVNFDSVLLSFQEIPLSSDGGWQWVGMKNFNYIFGQIKNNVKYRNMFVNSASYIGFNLLIALPASIIAAYILFKRIPASGFFRVLMFLPSIIPIAVLALAFRVSLDSMRGFVPALIRAVGITPPEFFQDRLSSQISIYLFMLWSGLGFNIILISGAMARIPMDVLESGKLEGVRPIRELVQIFIPLIWPTLTTLVIFALMSVFSVTLQPLLISGNYEDNKTIGSEIFSIAQSPLRLQFAAALGLMCTVVGAPVVVLVKFLMEKFYADVDF